jgi:3-phenylpropionate/cinnamic acid dioxygenase small subunit
MSFDSSAVTAALGSAEPEVDRLVRELVAVSSLLTDRGDLDDFAAILEPDVSWQMPDGLTVGAADVMAGMRSRREAGHTGPGSNTKHVVTTLFVHRAGADRAVAESNWIFYADTDGTPRPAGAGRYFDTFRRSDQGAWRFESRVSARG